MYMKVRSIFLAIVSMIFLLPAHALQGDELVVYSGRSDKFVKPVIEAFTRDTGITVILHTASSTALLNKLRLEGERTEADLYLSNDAGNLQIGSDLGLFQPVSQHIASAIAPNLRAPDNSWIGLSARARVLVVNKNSVNTGDIRSVFDLARPALKGRLAITTSSNESFVAGVTVYTIATSEDRVKEWLIGMKTNVAGEVFAKHSKIVAAVAAGKKDVGLVNHYYIYRHLATHPDAPLQIILPDQGEQGIGVAWNVAGIAMTQHTRKKVLAEKLIAYLVSEQGQKMFAEANREYPTRVGVLASPEIPPLGSYKVATVPMHELGRQRNATIDILEAIGMP